MSQESGPVRLILTLAGAGLASGVILAAAFIATEARIRRNRAEALEAAVGHVLPGVEKKVPLALTGDHLEPLEGTTPSGEETQVFAGYAQDGRLVGYAILGLGPGFQDTIRLIYGLDASERKVVGLEVLESRETPGLGDKIMEDRDFIANFKALSIDPLIRLARKGTQPAENEINAISGATISSKSVVRIINESNKKWLPLLNPAPTAEARP